MGHYVVGDFIRVCMGWVTIWMGDYMDGRQYGTIL